MFLNKSLALVFLIKISQSFLISISQSFLHLSVFLEIGVGHVLYFIISTIILPPLVVAQRPVSEQEIPLP